MSVSVVKADVCRPKNKTNKNYLRLAPIRRKKCFKAAFICQLQTSNSSSHRTTTSRIILILVFNSHTSISPPPHPPPKYRHPHSPLLIYIYTHNPTSNITPNCGTYIYTQSYFQHHTKLCYIHIYTHNPTSNITSHCCLSPTQNYLQLQSGRTT